MEEQWIRWEPIEGLSKKYYIESITYDSEELDIRLYDEKDRKKGLRIVFASVESYKWTEEGYALKTISILNETYGISFYANWTLFKIINSSYLQLLSEQSYTISDSLSLLHFTFIDPLSMVDVISKSEPKIELIVFPNERVELYDKPEDFDAFKDFDKMGLNRIKNMAKEKIGKVGILPDGTIVNVRTKSKSGRPILEIYGNDRHIKIRYCSKEG